VDCDIHFTGIFPSITLRLVHLGENMRRVFFCLIGLFLLPFSAAYAQDTQKVTIGAYVNDIQAVDLSTHSYVVDLYVWFRWQDPEIDPSQTFEFMNTFDPEAHVETVLYDEPVPQPDGSLYQIVRHQGAFSSKFPLARYPFDVQMLHVVVEDSEEGAQTLQFVPDENALTLNPEIKMPGYRITDVKLVVRDKPYPTNFGDLSEPDITAYSRADFQITIARPWFSGLFKSLLPVLLVLLCAVFALLLDPEHVEARIGLSITALLTLVALQFTMQASLPEVSYLTFLDQYYLASYFFILMVIALVVRGTRLDEKGAIQGGKGATAKLVQGGPFSALVSTCIYLSVIIALLVINFLR
jgi:hypothetical protein